MQALETLAVIAYKQPITALEITEIRGVNTSGVLNTLLERHLIKIVGRKQVVGRPFLYATTKEFLIRFGLNDLERPAEGRGHGRSARLRAAAAGRADAEPRSMLPLEEPDEPTRMDEPAHGGRINGSAYRLRPSGPRTRATESIVHPLRQPEGVCDQFVRATPSGVIVGDRHDDRLRPRRTRAAHGFQRPA